MFNYTLCTRGKVTRSVFTTMLLLMVLGLTSPAYAGKLALDVIADEGAFDAAFGGIGTGCQFYIPGKIFEAGTSKQIGTFHCWGWDATCDASVAVVVSQEFDLNGRGKIQVQGIEDNGPRAVVGGTGEFRNVRGEMTGTNLDNFPEFTASFKLIGAKNQ